MTMKTFFSILFLIFLQSNSFLTTATKYIVVNDAQNTRFDAEIGVLYTEQIMETITQFIWDIFRQYNSSERVQVETVTLYIDGYHNEFIGRTSGETPHKHINISSKYINKYQGDLKWHYTAVLHHEMTHVLQWYGNYPNNAGLIEGIADYMMLMSNYFPSRSVKPGQGDKWNHGYDVTARFLEYCEELRSGFVAGLNRMMKDDYSDDFFLQLMGKSVDQLWKEYKTKYQEIYPHI